MTSHRAPSTLHPPRATWVMILALFGTVIACAAPAATAQAIHLTGRGGASDWPETPLVVDCPTTVVAGHYLLDDGSGGSPIPACVFEDGDHRRMGAILPAVPAGRRFSYLLRPAQAVDSSDSTGIRFKASGANLDVTLDSRPLTTYRVEPGPKPCFFPLYGPTGDRFTRAFPMEKVPGEDNDHPHQRSCWFTFGAVNGIDFWSEGQGRGSIRETDRKIVADGPVLGRLRTSDDWLGPDGHRICSDHRIVTFYQTKSHRIIDFEFTIVATDGPVTFGDTKEGMFGVRVASSMDAAPKGPGRITNADGVTGPKTWGQASPWVDYVGPVKDQTVGIAIFNHPSSYRYPTIWHVRDYGLFAANPLGWKEFGKGKEHRDTRLAAGESLRFAYRVVLHRGDTASIAAPALFEAYSAGPSMEVRAD